MMSADFISTRGSTARNKTAEELEVVTFTAYKPKGKKPTSTPLVSDLTENDNNFNIKQAKYEIIKFGMSGFDPQKKEEAKIQQAIKLGAKPPKNKSKNYKLLLEERKKEKEKEVSRLSFQQLGKNSIGKSIAKGKSYDRKRKGNKADLLDIYGTVKKPADISKNKKFKKM